MAPEIPHPIPRTMKMDFIPVIGIVRLHGTNDFKKGRLKVGLTQSNDPFKSEFRSQWHQSQRLEMGGFDAVPLAWWWRGHVAGSSLQLTARKETSTSVLQPQRMNSANNPNELGRGSGPQTRQQPQSTSSVVWDPEQRPRKAVLDSQATETKIIICGVLSC